MAGASSSASPSPTWRTMCGPARRSTAPRSSAAIRSIFPTASCRCCRSASPTIYARCGRRRTAPALAVRMVIGADGRKRSHNFHRVMIRSAARLHYEQAQLAVSGRPDEVTEPIVKKILEPLYAAYRAVRRARDERGPLDLEIPERKIVLKSDGTVDRVITPQRLEAHRLIEEFMILANVAAAETCERAARPADLSRARRADAGKAQCAARISGDARHLAAQGRDVAAGRLQPHPGAGQGPRRRAAGQRGGAAQPGAGGIFAGQFRPFRPQSAPLCALHLADPPLRRPDRASRSDPGAQARSGRLGGTYRCARACPKSPPTFRRRSAAP